MNNDITIKQLDTEHEDFAPQLQNLYINAGWEKKPMSDGEHANSLANIRKALKNSYCCFGAFEGKTLIGFFRAISDGVNDAYLIDLFVAPLYRKLGIGTRLCENLVGRLKADHIEWITAISTPDGFPLYSKIGAQMKNHTSFRF